MSGEMVTRSRPADKYRTLADLLERLGNVPPRRIRYQPFPGTATEKDLAVQKAADGFYCELVDGTLVEKDVSFEASALAGVLISFLRAALGRLPLIAEDLGLITPDVEKLRDSLELPGMRVLQFAFGDNAENPYLPHNYNHASVAYTGTHDNDTTRGWYGTLTEKERDPIRRYLAREGSDIAWDFIRLAWSSVADLAIAPLQDVLNLGSQARMNTPGRPDGNWTWRIPPNAIADEVLGRLKELTQLYGRD